MKHVRLLRKRAGRPALARRAARIGLLGAVALAACSAPRPAGSALPSISAPVPAALPPTATAAASMAPIELTPTPAPPTATAAPTPAPPTETPIPPEPATIQAAPFAALRDEQIVERPARAVRALTDGERKYRLALWSPNSAWIAALPQDGPGMDIVDAATGAVLAITEATFVLEPIWAAERPGNGEPCLLLHLLADGDDRLDLVCVAGAGDTAELRSETILASDTALRSPAYSSRTLAYSSGDSLVLVARDPLAYPASLPGGAALSAALSPDAERPSLAWTPWAPVLTQVQTLIQRPGDQRPYALTAPGEGWWMARWAPGSDRLVMTSVEGRVGTATLDGSARFDLGPGTDPQWSPDGERIAFAGNGAGTEYTSRDIFVVDWQGAGPRLRLTRAGEEEIFVSPSWSPDGTRIAFVEIDTGQIFTADAP